MFLEVVVEIGVYGGWDVEGFVICCKMINRLDVFYYYDWFFKYKFEELYFMY